MGDSELANQHRAASGGEAWDPGVSDADDGAADALLDGPSAKPATTSADDPAALFAQEAARSAKDGESGPTIEPKKKPVTPAQEAGPDGDAEPAEGTDEDAPEPAAIEWKSLEDVQAALADADGVPPEIRPWLEATMSHLGPKVAELETQKADVESEKIGLQQSQKVLTELAARLEKAGTEGAVELTQNYMGLLENVDNMAGQLTRVSWRLFGLLHPEYAAMPEGHPLRTAFKKMLEAGDHFRLFEDEKDYYEQIERAYELGTFRTKTDLSEFAPKPATQPAAPAAPAKGPAMAALQRPARAAAPAARRGGSLVADGARAPTRRRVGVDERTDDEVMSEHEDLLGPN